MAQEGCPNGGRDMKKAMLVIRFAAGGAILSVSLVSIAASVFGYDPSVVRDIVAALGGGVLTAGIFAKAVGLFA
ncbi:hypothetical protein GCM10023174_06910 [Chelativorans composti]